MIKGILLGGGGSFGVLICLFFELRSFFNSIKNMEHNHLLSTHLQSKSVAIGLTCYPNICYQTHLLSTLNSVVITFICYQASFAIQAQLLSKHLLSNSFSINSVVTTFICYQTSLAIKQICYQ